VYGHRFTTCREATTSCGSLRASCHVFPEGYDRLARS
jgi:hypothetical protein